MAEIWGSVRAPDAAVFDRRLDQLASTVCRDDPRTQRQRRADAMAALAAGTATMECTCGSDSCPAATADSSPDQIVIHVLAEAATLEGKSAKAGFLPGYGALPAEAVKNMARRAKVRPLILPQDWPAEPRYRPSAALADVVRCRDLTCRFPNCDQPAEVCDIDHKDALSGGADAPLQSQAVLPDVIICSKPSTAVPAAGTNASCPTAP